MNRDNFFFMSGDLEGIFYGAPDAYIEESLDENKRTQIISTTLIGILAMGVFALAIWLAIKVDTVIFIVVGSISFLVFVICLILVIGFARVHNKKKRNRLPETAGG